MRKKFILIVMAMPFAAWAQVQKNVVEQLNSAVEQLQGFPSLEQANCVIGEGTHCSFSQMCSSVRGNRNSKNLFRGSDGRFFTNYNLLNLQSRLIDCRDGASLGPQSKPPPDPASEDAWLQKRNRLRKNLLASIKKNHEEKKYVAVENALLNMSMDDEEPSADAAKNLQVALKRARVRLSAESMKNWQALLSPAVFADETGDASASPSASLLSDNPYMNPDLLSDPRKAGSVEKMKSYQAEFQKDVDRGYHLFQDSQKRIIAMLQKRRTKENAEKLTA